MAVKKAKLDSDNVTIHASIVVIETSAFWLAYFLWDCNYTKLQISARNYTILHGIIKLLHCSWPIRIKKFFHVYDYNGNTKSQLSDIYLHFTLNLNDIVSFQSSSALWCDSSREQLCGLTWGSCEIFVKFRLNYCCN